MQTSPRVPDRLPASIAASWRRSSAAGLTPQSSITPSPMGSARGRLAVAAEPVLDRFETEIADSPFAVVLADRSCRLIDLRFGQRARAGHAADTIGLEPGSMFTEENSGTNAIATPFETRTDVHVDGEQHFLECLHRFTCYGLPIFHPVTRRLEGVIDMMVDRPHASPLMRPALHRLVDEIGERLRSMSGRREQVALDAFLAASADHTAPIVVLEGELTLSNRAAREELDATDYAELADLAARPPGDRSVVLASGATVEVRTSDLPDGGGTLCTFAAPRVRPPVPRGGNAQRRSELQTGIDRLQALRTGTVLITGEPGSGRSTTARAVGGTVVCCGTEPGEPWIDTVFDDGTPVVVDDAHLLAERDAARLARALERAPGRVVLTTTGATGPSGEHAALAACCTEHLAVPPLRDRGDEFATIAARMLDDLTGGRVRLTLAAAQLLRRRPWPGNLRELRAVLAATARHRPAGDIAPADLPEAYRTGPRHGELTPLEAAEADTIVAALRATGGNKAHTATRLGISRSTLYTRLRSYGIRA